MTPIEWYKRFLEARGLSNPDTRHLYEYRVKEFEFASLQESLKACHINFNYLQLFDACFTIYAAEWWRRNFNGGHWTWKTISESINKQLKQNEWSLLVEGGLKKWNQKVLKDSANKNDYLVTIIIEGGLPLETVSKEGNWLKMVVTQSFKELRELSSSEYTLEDLVQRNAESVRGYPASLKKFEIYTLLGRIIRELSELRKAYNLVKLKSAVQILDQKKSDWRLSFPIQIDTPVGRKFVDELLSEIVAIPEPKVYQIMMKRVLLKNQDGWSIRGVIELPNMPLDYEDLRLTSQEAIDNYPSKMDVIIQSSGGDKRKISTAYKTSKNGINVIKMSGTCLLDGELALSSWSLYLSFLTDEVELPLPNGDVLSSEAPWTFVNKKGEWLFTGAASQQTKSESVIVILKREDKIQGEYKKIGDLGSRSIIEISNDITVFSVDGDLYKIKTKSVNEDNMFILNGTKYDLYSKKAIDTFLGVPIIYKQKEDTLFKTLASGSTQVRLAGTTNSWLGLQQNVFGLVDLRLLGKEQEILFSKRIAILPSNFSIQVQSLNPVEGKLFTQGTSAFKLKVFGPDIISEIRSNSDGHEIVIKSTREIPPEFVILSLSVPNSSGDIQFEIPFPAKGAKFFDKSGSQLKRTDILYLNKLNGTRLHLFGASQSQNKYHLKFSLKDQYVSDSREIYLKEAINIDKTHKEVSLVNFENNFRSIFSVSTNLDKEVLLDISTSQGNNSASIAVKQYSCSLATDSNTNEFILPGSLKDLINTEVLAFRLDIPYQNQEPIRLNQLTYADSVKWAFNQNDVGAGVWFIYPSERSEIMFRPKTWTREAEQAIPNEAKYLSDVVFSKDISMRIQSLKALAEKMSTDFSNDNWGDLGFLWKWTKHLPLSALDSWTALSQSHSALIAALCRQDKNLVDRLSLEFPIVWECISIEKWIRVFEEFKKYCDEISPEYSDELVEDKIQYVEKQLSLGCVGEIIRLKVLGKTDGSQYLIPAPDNVKQDFILTQYKGTQGTTGLLGHKATWPESLRDEITLAFNNLPETIKRILPAVELDHQKSVVFLPALLAYKTIEESAYPAELPPNKVFQMTITKSFDQSWFYFLYNTIQAHYWMTKN